MKVLTPEKEGRRPRQHRARPSTRSPGSQARALPRTWAELVPWPSSSNSLKPHPRLDPEASSPPYQAKPTSGKPLRPPLRPWFLQEMVRTKGGVLIPRAPTLVCANFHPGLPATAYLPRAKRLEKSSQGPQRGLLKSLFPRGRNN